MIRGRSSIMCSAEGEGRDGPELIMRKGHMIKGGREGSKGGQKGTMRYLKSTLLVPLVIVP